MIGYIYVLWDKNENDIFYVGASKNPYQRVKDHRTANYYYDEDLNKIKYDNNINVSVISEIEYEEEKELRRE